MRPRGSRQRAAAAIAAGVILASCLSTADNTPPLQYDMKDGQGQQHLRSGASGVVLLALWGDRGGSEFMEKWSPALNDSLAGLAGVRRLDFAHVKGAPFFIKGKIRKRFRENWPGTVLLDWEGEFRRAYACAQDSCTAILFDREGRPQRRWTVGELDPDLLAEMTEAARQAASVATSAAE